MPVKRQYRVKGTNDFIVLAGIFFFLCLWSIKDAWFPSEKVLTKHPQEIIVAAETGGTVEIVNVVKGDMVVEDMVLAKLRSDRVTIEFEAAKQSYTEAKQKHALLTAASQEGDPEEIAAAQAAMDLALTKVDDLRVALDSMEIKAPDKGAIKESYIVTLSHVEVITAGFDGEVVEILPSQRITVADDRGEKKEYSISEMMVSLVNVGEMISEGDTLAVQKVFLIDPQDHFYLFNKSLAIFSFVVFWVFLAVHLMAR